MDCEKRIGHRVGILVSESGKTHEDYGKMVGLPQATISRLVKGIPPRVSTLEKISDSRKIPIEYFFVEDDREAEYLLHPERRVEEENKQDFLVNEFKNAFQNEQEKNRRLKEELAEKEAIIREQSARDDIPLNVKELAKALLKATETLIEAL